MRRKPSAAASAQEACLESGKRKAEDLVILEDGGEMKRWMVRALQGQEVPLGSFMSAINFKLEWQFLDRTISCWRRS